MTIGPDIKEAIEEVGLKYTILRDVGNITGEYLTYKPNAQVTKPFIQEFFLEAALVYDTQILVGDIVQFDVPGDNYIVMNKTPDLFENEIIRFNGVLYKCNIVADIYRPDDTGARDAQYHQATSWSLVKSSVNALLTTPLYGVDLETDLELGMIGVSDLELYIPSSIGLEVLDRVVISSSEYYRAETIKKRRYSAVDVCDIGEDTRPVEGSGITSWYDAENMIINEGSINSGGLSDTYVDNGVRLELNEVTATPGFDYIFEFKNVPTNNVAVLINGYYEGNPGHRIKISAFNFTTYQWTPFTGSTDDFPSRGSDDDYQFNMPAPRSEYLSDREVKIRFEHTSPGTPGHYFRLDRLRLTDIS
jgi:hypothetical protein